MARSYENGPSAYGFPKTDIERLVTHHYRVSRIKFVVSDGLFNKAWLWLSAIACADFRSMGAGIETIDLDSLAAKDLIYTVVYTVHLLQSEDPARDS